MSKTMVIMIAVAVVIIAIAIGGYASRHAPQPAATANQSTRQDSAAKSASRAMTFTQPKAPSK